MSVYVQYVNDYLSDEEAMLVLELIKEDEELRKEMKEKEEKQRKKAEIIKRYSDKFSDELKKKYGIIK